MTTRSSVARWLSVVAMAVFAGALLAVAMPIDEAPAPNGEKWLSIVDDQKYEESWNQASAMFRGKVKQEQWVAALKRSREPLGALVSRTTSRVELATTLREAPDGDYAIIHFNTAFANKSIVTERLTLVREDGRWKMAAYAIY